MVLVSFPEGLAVPPVGGSGMEVPGSGVAFIDVHSDEPMTIASGSR